MPPRRGNTLLSLYSQALSCLRLGCLMLVLLCTLLPERQRYKLTARCGVLGGRLSGLMTLSSTIMYRKPCLCVCLKLTFLNSSKNWEAWAFLYGPPANTYSNYYIVHAFYFMILLRDGDPIKGGARTVFLSHLWTQVMADSYFDGICQLCA